MIAESSTDNSIELGELNVDENAVIRGKIAIHHSFYYPGNEAQSLVKYQKLFEKQKQFALIKAQKLIGRASFLNQDEARRALKDPSGSSSYFEKFVKASGKKLALQHDYTNNTLWLKIVDENEHVDKDGCLNDIGKQ